jgi:glycosyltransferase involved in cell wall biosynthesis
MATLGLRVPVSYIPLGLGSEAWEQPPRPDWLRSRLAGRDRGRPIVLFLSRLHPKKGIADFLLPAFAGLRSDAFLVIAGGEDSSAPGYESLLRSEIARLGLTDRVHLFGPVEPADRWAAYDGAALFVLPSRQENFGLVITEAMARGCPVVVSEHAYACEHLTAAGAGRVVPLSATAHTAAIDELLTAPDLRAEMGRRGKAYVPAHLDWDRIAESIVEMYQECAAGARR